MAKEEFVIGDYVFAKVRGYPAWPAKIIAVLDPRPATMKFTVFFYGTSETATVTAKEVFHYESNKEQFGKPIKRKFFIEGIAELEKDRAKFGATSEIINENSSEPTISQDIQDSKTSKRRRDSRTSVDSLTAKKKRISSLSVAAVDIDLSEESPLQPPLSKRGSRRNNSVELSASGKASTEPEEERKVSEARNKRQSSVIDETGHEKAQEPASKKRKRKSSLDVDEGKQSQSLATELKDQEAPPRKKISSAFLGAESKDGAMPDGDKQAVSRSGRVIKPKKFLYDEENVKSASAHSSAAAIEAEIKADASASVPKKTQPLEAAKPQKKPRKAKVSETTDKPIESPPHLPTTEAESEKTPPAPSTPLRKNKASEKKARQSPLLSPVGRVRWVRPKDGPVVLVQIDHKRPDKFKSDKAQWDEAYEEHVKKKIELIEKGEEVLSPDVEVQLVKDVSEKDRKIKAQARIQGTLRCLNLEMRLLDINTLIRTCLQKDHVDLVKALSLMDELINLPIDALTLKKFPNIVDTAEKIQNYTGNVSTWNFTSEQESKFKKDASKIRRKADMLWNKYRGIFAVARTDDFRKVFDASVNEFKACVKDLPPEKLHALTCDPTSKYYKEVSEIDEEINRVEEELTKKLTGGTDKN